MSDQTAEVHGELSLSQVILRAKVCPECAARNAWDAASCTECSADLTNVQGPTEDRGIVSRGTF